jgi:hypothetical protein
MQLQAYWLQISGSLIAPRPIFRPINKFVLPRDSEDWLLLRMASARPILLLFRLLSSWLFCAVVGLDLYIGRTYMHTLTARAVVP